MKCTGIVRSTDDMDRIVVPKTLCKPMGWNLGQELYISINEQGMVWLNDDNQFGVRAILDDLYMVIIPEQMVGKGIFTFFTTNTGHELGLIPYDLMDVMDEGCNSTHNHKTPTKERHAMDILYGIMHDRSAIYESSNNVPVFIADMLAFILNDARRSKQHAMEFTTNGSYYRSLCAEVEMLDKLLKGTIIDI